MIPDYVITMPPNNWINNLNVLNRVWYYPDNIELVYFGAVGMHRNGNYYHFKFLIEINGLFTYQILDLNGISLNNKQLIHPIDMTRFNLFFEDNFIINLKTRHA